MRPTPLIRLIQTAADQKTLQGIGNILREVTDIMSAWGTLMWMPSPGSDLASGKGRLFVLAYWTQDQSINVWHEIPLENSVAGLVLRQGRPEQVPLDDPRASRPVPGVVEQADIKRFALAPMTMSDGTKAVLEIFRQEDEPFGDVEMGLLEEIAAVLPVLYANLADRVGVGMINDFSAECAKAEHAENPKSALPKIAELIFKKLCNLEISIFLRDLDTAPDVFPLVAQKTVFGDVTKGRTEYPAGKGATGYVLEQGRTVHLELSHYAQDIAWITDTYRGLVWEDSMKIRDLARDYFKISDPESSPPLSYVCAPIKSAETVLGAIRCCGATTSPFYLDSWNARYIEALAQRLGSWWSTVLKEEQMNREIASWELLMNGFDQMNRFVQRQIRGLTWDEDQFFREAMRLAHKVIPNTDNSDVAILEDDELATTSTYGPDWDSNPKAKTTRYSLHPPLSEGARLLAERNSVEVHNNLVHDPRLKRPFADTRKLIVAKVEAGDEVFGVLTIRSKSPRLFPPSARLVAGLLGQQLGLYHSLTRQIVRLHQAESKNRALIETQSKTLSDVHHQVKSPIINAHRAAQALIRSRTLAHALRPEAERIRGLCGKVSRVVRNMGVFADLAAGKRIHINRSLFLRDSLVRTLREVCEDHERLVDPDRHLSFQFDERSFAEIAGRDRIGKLIEGDWALLEQCINNLVDNAAKYSYDGTTVSVSGGLQARGTEFFISVLNEGFEVKPDEVAKLKMRGYRSDRAISATGEGSGIGLWLVDEIMRGHSGRLSITPTQHGKTDFRLVFPVTKGVEKLSDETQSALARG